MTGVGGGWVGANVAAAGIDVDRLTLRSRMRTTTAVEAVSAGAAWEQAAAIRHRNTTKHRHRTAKAGWHFTPGRAILNVVSRFKFTNPLSTGAPRQVVLLSSTIAGIRDAPIISSVTLRAHYDHYQERLVSVIPNAE
jgi:hypothetical protein